MDCGSRTEFKLKYKFLLLPRAPRQSPHSCPCPALGGGSDGAWPSLLWVCWARKSSPSGSALCHRQACKGECRWDGIVHQGQGLGAKSWGHEWA